MWNNPKLLLSIFHILISVTKQCKVPFYQNQQYLFMAWYDHLIMLLDNMKGSNNQPGKCSRATWDVKLFEQQSLIPTTWQMSTVLQLVDWHAPLRDHIYLTIFRSHICLYWMMWIYCVFSNNYLSLSWGQKLTWLLKSTEIFSLLWSAFLL